MKLARGITHDSSVSLRFGSLELWLISSKDGIDFSRSLTATAFVASLLLPLRVKPSAWPVPEVTLDRLW